MSILVMMSQISQLKDLLGQELEKETEFSG